MSLDLLVTAIGSRLLEWNTIALSDAIVKRGVTQFHPGDIEPALKSAIMSAHRREKRLFTSDDKDSIHKFLDQVFIENELVLKELCRPFVEHQPLQENLLLQGIQQVLAKTEFKINEKNLENWLKIFANTYFRETQTLGWKIAKREYLQKIASWCETTLFSLEYPLSKIFVLPEAAEEIYLQSENPEVTGEKIVAYQRSPNHFSSQFLLKLIHSQKIVILGENGIGKTALLKYFIHVLSTEKSIEWGFLSENAWLPIFISIPDFIRSIPDLSLLDYLQEFTVKEWQYIPPKGFFEYWLDEGRSLILIDGLNQLNDSEIPDQKNYVDKFSDFLRNYEQNPAMITVRQGNYQRELLKTTHCGHYYLQGFDDQKIQQFVKQWYGNSEEENVEILRHEALVLQNLNEQNWLKSWLKNPLLLTSLLLVHPLGMTLPKHKSEILERVVEHLFSLWQNLPNLNYLTTADFPLLMQQLASEMHLQEISVISQTELEQKLTAMIQELKQISPDQALAESKTFVKGISEKVGILSVPDGKNYTFIVPTLQTFFAAQFINQNLHDRAPAEKTEIILDYLNTYQNNPHWQELLLLLIGQQTPEQLTEIIKAIVQRPNPYEVFFHENLIWASRCIAENMKPSDQELLEQILEEFIKIAVKSSHQLGNYVSEQVTPILENLKRTQYAEKVQELWQKIHHTGEKLSLPQTMNFAEISPGNITTWLKELQAQNPEVRRRAAINIGKHGEKADWIIQGLLTRLQDPDFNVRAAIVEALGLVGTPTEGVILPLMAHLQDQMPLVRANATIALSQLGDSSDTIIYPLLSLLQDGDAIVRASTIQALGDLKANPDAVLPAILNMLSDASMWVKSSAAIASAQLAPGSDAIMQILFSMSQDAEGLVRASVAKAFGILGYVSEDVMQLLLNLMQKDEKAPVRSNAAKALVQLGKPIHEVIEIMTQWLEQNPDTEGVGVEIDTLRELLTQINIGK
jgi:HEAT repeat protein/energy-coupling factor transporter ATP-binding protein EcfA2